MSLYFDLSAAVVASSSRTTVLWEVALDLHLGLEGDVRWRPHGGKYYIVIKSERHLSSVH